MIGRAYLVIDEVGGVIQASPGAYAMGLVRGHTVASDKAGDGRTVRHRGIILLSMHEIDRGEGETLVLMRVASLGGRAFWCSQMTTMRNFSCSFIMRNDFVANVFA